MTPLANPSPSVTDTSHLDATTVSGVHQQEAHGELTSDHCGSGPSSRNTNDMTVRERLKTVEEAAGEISKADPSVTAAPTLEQRVIRLEQTLAKHLHNNDSSDNSHDGLGVMPDLGTLHTGNSQTSSSKVSDATIKEQHPAKAKKLFNIPQICLAEFHIDEELHKVAACPTDDGFEYISGSPESLVRATSILHAGEDGSSDLACLPLLRSLQLNEWQLHGHGCYDEQPSPDDRNANCQLVGPALRFHEMSSDSMPSGAMRPFVMTTVSEIAILARRLGMSWEVFDPEGGTMRARGNGHGIFSLMPRPDCLVLQYDSPEFGVTSTEKRIFLNDKIFSKSELYIPTREADMMGFGILPGCIRLNIASFKLGTNDYVYATMDILDSTRKASAKLRFMNRLLERKWDAHCMYGFPDIIALAAPMIRGRHSTVVRVPTPAEYCSSLLSQKECFVVFHNRLKRYIGERWEDMWSEQPNWVLKRYERLKSRYSEWENEAENIDRVNGRDLNFLEEVHDGWDAATDYLVQIQEKHNLRYLNLMASHISHAVNYWCDAWQRIKEGNARDNYGLRVLEAEGSHLYFDNLPLIVDDMRRKGFEGPEELVHEAWFTLMFRAFCWWRCHSLHPGEDPSRKGSPLPSQYWDCQVPVCIR